MGELCNMNDKIIELKEYKNIIENKKELDNKVKTVDDLSLEELEDVSNLYQNEVSKLSQEVNILEKENLELSNCIKKIYIENNHKIDQNIPNEETNINSLMSLTNEELDKKDKLIKKLKTEAKMADLSDIEKLKKEELKEFKNLYNKNLKIINDALKQFGKE